MIIWICRWRMNKLVTSQYQPRLSSITKIFSRRISQSDWNIQIKLNYSPLNNRVIQWTCVILEVIHRWRRLEAKISRLFYVMWLSFNQWNWFFIMSGIIIIIIWPCRFRYEILVKCKENSYLSRKKWLREKIQQPHSNKN